MFIFLIIIGNSNKTLAIKQIFGLGQKFDRLLVTNLRLVLLSIKFYCYEISTYRHKIWLYLIRYIRSNRQMFIKYYHFFTPTTQSIHISNGVIQYNNQLDSFLWQSQTTYDDRKQKRAVANLVILLLLNKIIASAQEAPFVCAYEIRWWRIKSLKMIVIYF